MKNRLRRWMAKIICCLKIYLFRNEREVDPEILQALRDFILFIVIVYLKYWYMCPSSTSAPKYDLNLIQIKWINERIADAALSSFKNHLWYISEILIALAFFDSKFDISTKEKMVKNLARPGSKFPLNRIKIHDMDEIGHTKI